MKKKITLACLLTAAYILSSKTAKSQTLKPDELIAIHHLQDSSAITNKLGTKGYKTAYGWDLKGREKVSNWIFQTQPGEFADLTVRKVTDASNKTTTVYWISNIYQYKEFMASLTGARFRFNGVQILDDRSYFTFKRGNENLCVTEKQAGKETYYEVRLN